MTEYRVGDLEVRQTARRVEAEGVTTHFHSVVFARPLTSDERDLFTRLLNGFYYAVHFSGLFGDNLVAEPAVEFDAPDQARYVLRQRGVSGAWKDLLFAMLAKFSRDVAPILKHDDSHIFAPARQPVEASAD